VPDQRYCKKVLAAILPNQAKRYTIYTLRYKKIIMNEQQLINAFMKLVAKVGAGELIRQMIQLTDENGNPKIWTANEIDSATHFINHQIENFGRAEALMVVKTLIDKFDIREHDLQLHSAVPDPSGIQGLQ
jgi:hypothetical protein